MSASRVQRWTIPANAGPSLSARVVLLPFYKASDLKSRVAFLHDRAIRLFAEQHDDKAVELLMEALRLDPAFADGYEALGMSMGRTGRFHEAIDIFKRLEEVAPDEPMVHTNLSLYYMKLGDKQAAEEAATRLQAWWDNRRDQSNNDPMLKFVAVRWPYTPESHAKWLENWPEVSGVPTL